MDDYAKYFKNITIIIAIGCITLLLVTILMSPPPAANLQSEQVKGYDTGWSYVDADGKTQIVELPYRVKGSASNKIPISNTLPQQLTDDWVFSIKSIQQTIQVHVDGVLIFDNNAQESKYFNVPPNAWNIVELSAGMAGKQIVVTYEMPYKMQSYTLADMYIGDHQVCLNVIWRSGLVFLIITSMIFLNSVFIFIFGAIFKDPKQKATMLNLGGVTLSCSLWLLTSGEIIQFMIGNMYIATVGNVIFRILLSIYTALFMRGLTDSVKYKKILNIFLVIFIVAIPFVTLVQLFTPLDCAQLTLPLQMLNILLCIAILCIAVYSREKSQHLKPICPIAILLMALYLIEAYYHLNPLFLPHVFTVIAGGFLFILTIIWVTYQRTVYISTEENNQMREQIVQGRVQLMLSQIKPHFIYNALNSIYILIKKDPDIACSMVTNFSTYLRSNMNAMGSKRLVSFSEELAHIKAYVEIEKVRFPNIGVAFEIDERNFNIPILTVEPLVENAIKHGVAKARGGGIVTVRAYRSSAFIYIEVQDNGVGFDVGIIEAEREDSIGLKNVIFRLESMMNGQINIKSKIGEGTIAQIKLPIDKVKGGKISENDIG